jgi:hypothetical protein
MYFYSCVMRCMTLCIYLWDILYAIAIDPGTITMVQRFRFSTKIWGFTLTNIKGPQMVWVPKATWRHWVRGLWRLDRKKMWRFKARSQACKLDMCCRCSPFKVMETRTHVKYLCSSIALSRFAFVAMPSWLHMVGCLCHVLTHEQPTWFD